MVVNWQAEIQDTSLITMLKVCHIKVNIYLLITMLRLKFHKTQDVCMFFVSHQLKDYTLQVTSHIMLSIKWRLKYLMLTNINFFLLASNVMYSSKQLRIHHIETILGIELMPIRDPYFFFLSKTQQEFVRKIKNLKQLNLLNKPFIHGMQQFDTYIVNHKRKFNHSKLLKASHTWHHYLKCLQISEKHLHKENLNFEFVPNNSMKSSYINSYIYKHQEPILMEVL
jgi:hypothetical protein